MMRKLCASAALVAALVGSVASVASAQAGAGYNNLSTLTGSLLTVLERDLNAHQELPDHWNGTCWPRPVSASVVCAFTGFWRKGIRIDGMLGECGVMFSRDITGDKDDICDVYGRSTSSGRVTVRYAYVIIVPPSGDTWHSTSPEDDVTTPPLRLVPYPLICHPGEHC